MNRSQITPLGPFASFFAGGCGCLTLLAIGVVAVAAFGVRVRVDLLILLVLFIAGGVAGHGMHLAYQSGYAAGLDAPRPGPDGTVPRKPKRIRPRPFVAPWKPGEEPHTAREALEQFSGVAWSDLPHELVIEEEMTSARLSAPGGSDAALRVTAREGEDEVTLHLDDALGEIFVAPGPWRDPAAPNAFFAEVQRIVEGLRTEALVHTLSGDGRHAIADARELESQIEADPDLRVRSWRGAHDRG